MDFWYQYKRRLGYGDEAFQRKGTDMNNEVSIIKVER